ncbi:MAG: redox-regulated ATPase YchF [Deltaproteobacteria bacterium RBG_16_47_11]|nr:MAG: redox-regulated ATPase YchF [Deltaproteobacteria bacterium RBG_16_47_11]
MKLGLVGFPQVGKRTLFRLLTGKEPNSEGKKRNGLGLARVRDARFDRLVEIYAPREETPAHIEFLLLPDLDQQVSRNEQILRDLEQVDVICHLVRTFQDDTVFHIHGTVGPHRDILLFNEELQLNDLLFIEKRLERLGKEQNKKRDVQKMAMEADLLTRMKENLETGCFLRDFLLTEAEEKLIDSYPLLTRKAVIIILNVGEEVPETHDLMDQLKEDFREQEFQWIAVSAKIEQELCQLDATDRQTFLEELQLDQPALDRLTMLCYKTLGLISFFTVGPDEVRAWTDRQGSLAPQAAGVIHSDFERGFIRAEVMKYQDLIKLGSEQKVREVGKYMQKGRDYVVEDGDIINFLFNV